MEIINMQEKGRWGWFYAAAEVDEAAKSQRSLIIQLLLRNVAALLK